MDRQIVLPHTNDNGYYEIRLESIGGLGANLCGKMLGELGAVYLNLNAASFSSYGSEKRGSPVKAFIRYSAKEQEIGINSPVETPDILGLFHEAMIGKETVTAGVKEYTRIVINTSQPPEIMREQLRLYAGSIYCIDALKIAMEVHTRINMVMLGAIAKVSGFLPMEALVTLVNDTIGKKYPNEKVANLVGMKRGYEEVVGKKFEPDGYAYVPYQEVKNQWGYETAPIGGVNTCFGSTASNDLSPSREGFIPLFYKERCIHCGLCDTTCPDMVFQFDEEEKNGKTVMVNKGPDYRYCKGCLRCVEVCPTNALVKGAEREHPNPLNGKKDKDLLPEDLHYEKVGANSYITSEAYLTERRNDGGLV